MTRPEYGYTPAEFASLECNRCGDCCEDFSLGGKGPIELLRFNVVDYPVSSRPAMDFQIWLGGLTPTQRDSGWFYSCSRFERDASGLGSCTAHATRPGICSEFPYGRQITTYPNCSFNVPVVEFLD